jgi:hypothetical protein
MRQWLDVTIRGTSPPRRWSAASVMLSKANSIFQYGGYAGELVYDSPYLLLLDVGVDASNCQASGIGTQWSRAGDTTWFTIVTRASTLLSNGSVVWGEQLSYGNGLTFEVRAVAQAARGIQFQVGDVTELGNGVYNVTYTVIYGSLYSLFVRLDDIDVPGSPFQVTVIPRSADGSTSRALGRGLQAAVRDEVSSFIVQSYDEFENTRYNSTVDEVSLIQVWPSSLQPTIINNGNGSFTVTYIATVIITPPPHQSSITNNAVISIEY